MLRRRAGRVHVLLVYLSCHGPFIRDGDQDLLEPEGVWVLYCTMISRKPTCFPFEPGPRDPDPLFVQKRAAISLVYRTTAYVSFAKDGSLPQNREELSVSAAHGREHEHFLIVGLVFFPGRQCTKPECTTQSCDALSSRNSRRHSDHSQLLNVARIKSSCLCSSGH